MRGVAMADLHLGFTGPGRQIGGRSVRELDVEAAFEWAIYNAIRLQPDLVTIAGDILHHPRVSMHAITAYRDGIRRLVRETGAHVVILQGNHDAAKSSAGKSPIVIPDDYERVYVILEPTRLPLTMERTGERVAVACFPFVALGSEVAYRVEPDPAADVNVLVVHAAVKSAENGDLLPRFYGGAGALDVGREAERWDVIAVGDYHEFTRLHPERLAFYSGSIERTSSNIWPEAADKGVVAYDTAAATLELVPHPTRPTASYDLGDFGSEAECTAPVSAERFNCALRQLAEHTSTEDAIIRLQVDGFPRTERDLIDWRLVRDLKQRCVHFHPDVRFARAAEAEASDRRDRGARTLAEEARDFFAGDRSDVRDLALRHLEVQQDPAAAALPEELELAEVTA